LRQNIRLKPSVEDFVCRGTKIKEHFNFEIRFYHTHILAHAGVPLNKPRTIHTANAGFLPSLATLHSILALGAVQIPWSQKPCDMDSRDGEVSPSPENQIMTCFLCCRPDEGDK
jgi:hypothetical protein